MAHTGAHLDLSAFSSPEELSTLGLDRLKSALIALGLKCGGTLEVSVLLTPQSSVLITIIFLGEVGETFPHQGEETVGSQPKYIRQDEAREGGQEGRGQVERYRQAGGLHLQVC